MGSKDSWFDDPEWVKLRDEIRGRKFLDKPKKTKSRATPEDHSREPKKVKLTLDLSLPNLKLPSVVRLPAVHKSIAKVRSVKPARKKLIIAGGVSCMLLIGGIGIIKASTAGDKSNAPAEGVLSQTVTEPEFEVILPDGKKEETETGKLGYDPAKKVASFTDTISNVAVTVSQQPLPDSFKDNPDEELKKLAGSFSANEIIAESNPKAYLGTSAKGPQTVILHKKGVLVFIQSASQIEKSDWAAYITKLL